VARHAALAPSLSTEAKLGMPTQRRVHEEDRKSSLCCELPGHTEVSPTELAAFEHGTYEEVKKELIATARQMARQLRQKQTMQQLERLQLDDPEIIRLRHLPPTGTVELDSELRGPVELPGCDMTAPSPDPDPCVYELNAVDNLHDLQVEYLTTPDITQPRGSETEPPRSGLESVGEPKCGDHLVVPLLAPAGRTEFHNTQDVQAGNGSHFANDDNAALKVYDGHLIGHDSSTCQRHNESRRDYSIHGIKYINTGANFERGRQGTPQAHPRLASGSGTLRNVDREDERQSVFTDLETLVKALPARTSWRQTS
ncbi:MAG: hypothetical protein Q9198_005495, partial [Flavoplaca austrocitrina]